MYVCVFVGRWLKKGFFLSSASRRQIVWKMLLWIWRQKLTKKMPHELSRR